MRPRGGDGPGCGDRAESLVLQGFAYGGDERIRTADLLSAIQALGGMDGFRLFDA